MLRILLNITGLAFATVVMALALLSVLVLTLYWDGAMKYLMGT